VKLSAVATNSGDQRSGHHQVSCDLSLAATNSSSVKPASDTTISGDLAYSHHATTNSSNAPAKN
jgi:hypothetical protein